MPDINIFDSINVSEKADIGNFVKRVGAQFIKDGTRLRFAGVNKYQLMVSGMSQPQVAAIMADCAALHIPVVRTWAFDTATSGPLHHLIYPLVNTNLITNTGFETDTSGWVLGGDWSRSNSDAHSGSWSLKQLSAFNSFSAVTYQLSVTANTDYVLSFYYKLSVLNGGQPNQLPTQVKILNSGGGTLVDGGLLGGASTWTFHQLKFNTGSNTTVSVALNDFGGNIQAFFDDFDFEVAATPVIQTIESTYQQLDMVLDEARKAGVKLILSLVDSNEFNFNGKHIFVNWTNSINPGANLTDSFPYSAFFTDSRVQAVYKQTFLDLATRVNTVNSRTYASDDAIFAWELGNELRYNSGDANINTLSSSVLAAVSLPGGWADIMSTYIKSKDPNHLVSFGDMSHTWQYVGGDTVSNGTYYGVDYDYLTRLTNIDYLDFHIYPNQSNGGRLLPYGQRLGYPAGATAAGFVAQLQDYVARAKANGKPAIIGEVGYVREEQADNAVITQYPRLKAFELIFNTVFAAGGDGALIWNAEGGDGGTYTFNIANTWDGNATNANFNDIPLCSIYLALNTQGTGIVPANATVGDAATTADDSLSGYTDPTLLSFSDNITVGEYTSEINKDPSVEYDSLFEGAQISESATPSQVDNINLSLTISGPHIVG